VHYSVTVTVVSIKSRLEFDSNGPMMSTCKCNTNKMKNEPNKMCIKTTINAQLEKLIA